MKRVLIVDASELTHQLLRSVSTRNGDLIEAAKSTPEALDKLFGTAFDLIVMDINLPQADGVELLYILRMDPVYRGVPIAVLSANSEPGDIEKAMKAGASLYVIKPAETEKLLDCIQALLQAV
ncbi:MAG TPA: response regulator [Symbiobacteriaceae bacterium]